MTKKEFIEILAEKSGENKKKAGELLDVFLGSVEEALQKSGSLQFVGWGTFEVKATAERMGRNPKTGEDIKIPAKKAVKFKVGKKLADLINQ